MVSFVRLFETTLLLRQGYLHIFYSNQPSVIDRVIVCKQHTTVNISLPPKIHSVVCDLTERNFCSINSHLLVLALLVFNSGKTVNYIQCYISNIIDNLTKVNHLWSISVGWTEKIWRKFMQYSLAHWKTKKIRNKLCADKILLSFQ